MHFATDYLRLGTEKSLVCEHDLSTIRTENAVNRKREVLNKICHFLIEHINEN